MILKRILPVVLIFTMLPFGIVCAEESLFSDLTDEHWAYGTVKQMVEDGRVNGYPDGEFKPAREVSRWEFVKMMGGQNPDETTEPNRMATRGEAAEFLWIKAGKPKNVAPSVVTKDAQNTEAAAWAYASGIMQGDDGLNLRLNSSLTRAEASALIIRSESGELAQNDFKTTVDSKILEKVWNSMLTGRAYAENKGINNGLLSHIAVCLGYEKRNPLYQTLLKNPEFDERYAKDLQLVCQECLGEEYATAEFYSKAATVQDVVAVLSFYAMKQSAEPILYSAEKNYADVKAAAPMAEMGLKFARHNGIFLYASDELKAEKPASMADIACVLLQLDEIVGLNKSSGEVKALKILKKLDEYPQNAEDYAYIISGIPKKSYETPLISGITAKRSYDFVNDSREMFVTFLTSISKNLPEGVTVKWTFVPSLVAESENDLVIRAGLEIASNPNGLSLNEIFTRNSLQETMSGNKFWVDISVGTNIDDIILDTSKYTVIRAFEE